MGFSMPLCNTKFSAPTSFEPDNACFQPGGEYQICYLIEDQMYMYTVIGQEPYPSFHAAPRAGIQRVG